MIFVKVINIDQMMRERNKPVFIPFEITISLLQPGLCPKKIRLLTNGNLVSLDQQGFAKAKA